MKQVSNVQFESTHSIRWNGARLYANVNAVHRAFEQDGRMVRRGYYVRIGEGRILPDAQFERVINVFMTEAEFRDIQSKYNALAGRPELDFPMFTTDKERHFGNYINVNVLGWCDNVHFQNVKAAGKSNFDIDWKDLAVTFIPSEEKKKGRTKKTVEPPADSCLF